MNVSMHQRAEQLILEDHAAGISPADREWLRSHLAVCGSCAAIADATHAAIGLLRSVPVVLDPVLIRETRFRVRQRAHELQEAQRPQPMLWLAFILTWVWMGATTPYVWRCAEWIAGQMGIPRLMWQMGFGLWWVLPALAVGAIMSQLKLSRSDQHLQISRESEAIL